MTNHSHVFVDKNQGIFETRTWLVMFLCLACMILEIVCGTLFGSLALIADGMHMGTHCIAFFFTAFAYSYSRKHQDDPFFVFGTGKILELASFTSAFILVVVALIIAYEAVERFISPEIIIFNQAFPIAFVGLSVNIASGFILICRCGRNPNVDDNEIEMSHGHSHGHSAEYYQYDEEGGEQGNHDERFEIHTPQGTLVLSIFEDGVPPEFRIECSDWKGSRPTVASLTVTTARSDGQTQVFRFAQINGVACVLRSTESIPEPHEFLATVRYTDEKGVRQEFSVHQVEDKGHSHAHHGHDHTPHDEHASSREHDDNDALMASGKNAKFNRDNNYRAAVCHVMADAFVSVLVIVALAVIGFVPGTQCLDPLVALVGAGVILSWSYTLIRDTALNLLDTLPDKDMVDLMRTKLEVDGDSVVTDLHVWRLGAGHLGAIISIRNNAVAVRDKTYYMGKLKGFRALSHVTVEIEHRP